MPSGGPSRGGTREDSARWDGNRLIILTKNTSQRIDPATNKPAVSQRTVTVQIGQDGSLIVDVAVKPPSSAGAGNFARHSVYRKQSK